MVFIKDFSNFCILYCLVPLNSFLFKLCLSLFLLVLGLFSKNQINKRSLKHYHGLQENIGQAVCVFSVTIQYTVFNLHISVYFDYYF